ncbi:hypothetical protein [Clostridium thailandense]|nr:hypothetical protein [Clostridium thailandense]
MKQKMQYCHFTEAFKKGTYLKVDTTCIKHIDIFSISEAFDKLVAVVAMA